MNNFKVKSIMFGRPNFFNKKSLKNAFYRKGVDPSIVEIPYSIDNLEELIMSFPNLEEIYYINNFVSKNIHDFLNSKEGIYLFVECNIKKVVNIKKNRKKPNFHSVYNAQGHWNDKKPTYIYSTAS